MGRHNMRAILGGMMNMDMIDRVSVVTLQEPSGIAGDETLWIILGEDHPERDDVPIAYENANAIQILGPMSQATVEAAADQLVAMFTRMRVRVTRACFPGD
jgi:hypothetical protein